MAFDADATSRPAIELIGVDKSFGPVHANKNVNLRVERGVIHGIVGENGAGKSTLMSILYGFYEADAGDIRVTHSELHITLAPLSSVSGPSTMSASISALAPVTGWGGTIRPLTFRALKARTKPASTNI